MAIYANENGSLKDIALDKFQVATVKLLMDIKILPDDHELNYASPAEFGITKCKLCPSSRQTFGELEWYVPDAQPYKEVEDTYKFIIKRGTLPFQLGNRYTYSAAGTSTAILAEKRNVLSRSSNTYRDTYGYNFFESFSNGGTMSTYHSVFQFFLIIEDDGYNWRLEAIIYRTGSITEQAALNTNFTIRTGNYNYMYPQSDDKRFFLIQNLVYDELTAS